jgi:hypothetical protein
MNFLLSTQYSKNIEEFQFHGLQAGKSPPEYWRNLGSSKTRKRNRKSKVEI